MKKFLARKAQSMVEAELELDFEFQSIHNDGPTIVCSAIVPFEVGGVKDYDRVTFRHIVTSECTELSVAKALNNLHQEWGEFVEKQANQKEREEANDQVFTGVYDYILAF